MTDTQKLEAIKAEIKNHYWNLQQEKDLFNEVVDWSTTYYSVILKDGSEKIVYTFADENCDGEINTYYEYRDTAEGVDFDDILMWRKIDENEDCDTTNDKDLAKSNEEKAREIADNNGFPALYSKLYAYECIQERESAALEMAEWKDEQYKEREEGLQETINVLDVKLQKANESGMHYFDKCNVQKQQLIDKACNWLKNNARNYYSAYATEDRLIEDFKEEMKGGEE